MKLLEDRLLDASLQYERLVLMERSLESAGVDDQGLQAVKLLWKDIQETLCNKQKDVAKV